MINEWMNAAPKEEIQVPEPRLSAFQHHPQLDEGGGRITIVLMVRAHDHL